MALHPQITYHVPTMRRKLPAPKYTNVYYNPNPPPQESAPKGLGRLERLIMFPINRRGRLEEIARCRRLGFTPGCTVALKSSVAAHEGDLKLLCMHEMGILEWNLADMQNHEWKPMRIEWLSTPTQVTYERPFNLMVVE